MSPANVTFPKILGHPLAESSTPIRLAGHSKLPLDTSKPMVCNQLERRAWLKHFNKELRYLGGGCL